MANRNRPVQIIVRLTPEERALLSKRMELFGTNNMSAYIRKMILDGYMIRLDFPELRDYVSLQRRASNNFNQIYINSLEVKLIQRIQKSLILFLTK